MWKWRSGGRKSPIYISFRDHKWRKVYHPFEVVEMKGDGEVNNRLQEILEHKNTWFKNTWPSSTDSLRRKMDHLKIIKYHMSWLVVDIHISNNCPYQAHAAHTKHTNTWRIRKICIPCMRKKLSSLNSHSHHPRGQQNTWCLTIRCSDFACSWSIVMIIESSWKVRS